MAIYEKCPHDELTIIMRRYMMKIAEHFANQDNCLSLVTGESIGQVASQTMHSLYVTNEVCQMPVFRPCIGLDKNEIVKVAEKIGTYETSILPYEDCCTIFVAKHPVTKPRLDVIKRSERNLDDCIDELMKTAIETTEEIKRVYDKTGYIMDTHTAVASCVYGKYKKDTNDDKVTVIASTASPFKFTRSVMNAINPAYDKLGDFELVDELSKIGNVKVPNAIEEIRNAEIRHNNLCNVDEMESVVKKFLNM